MPPPRCVQGDGRRGWGDAYVPASNPTRGRSPASAEAMGGFFAQVVEAAPDACAQRGCPQASDAAPEGQAGQRVSRRKLERCTAHRRAGSAQGLARVCSTRRGWLLAASNWPWCGRRGVQPAGKEGLAVAHATLAHPTSSRPTHPARAACRRQDNPVCLATSRPTIGWGGHGLQPLRGVCGTGPVVCDIVLLLVFDTPWWPLGWTERIGMPASIDPESAAFGCGCKVSHAAAQQPSA